MSALEELLLRMLEAEWFANHSEHCRTDFPHEGMCHWTRYKAMGEFKRVPIGEFGMPWKERTA